MTITTTHGPARTTASWQATTTLVLGAAAALLTTTLAFISLGLGAVALVLGSSCLRRQEAGVRAAVGMAMASVSIYVILLEIFVLGG